MKKEEAFFKKMATVAIALIIMFVTFTYSNNKILDKDHVALSTIRLPASVSREKRYFNDEFISKVQPLLARRCIACHACYEAPCLMHFTSYEGIQRGLTKQALFNSLRTLPPNRIKDAPLYLGENNSPRWDQPEWVKRNFAPIFKLGIDGQINSSTSLFSAVLAQGKLHSPGFALNPGTYPTERVCSQNTEELQAVYQQYPQMGMPYALPALQDSEYQIFADWIKHGAPGPTVETQRIWNQVTRPNLIVKFENFFNATSLKQKLVARYIYEHAYMAHIHFSGTPNDEFYELIRASSEGNLFREIVTEKANDPITVPFIYRLHRIHDIIVRKTHSLWELNEEDLDEWKNLFLDPTWKNEENIQQYADSLDATDRLDPIKYFLPIPENARFVFMTKNAEMLVGEIIKGPSCSGKAATLAIKDHFWVFFLTAEGNEKYQQLKSQQTTSISKLFSKPISVNSVVITEKDIYPKMSLSLFRHYTNATIHKGLWGGDPQNILVLDYYNYEDIYYNLVINFKPWANTAHKVLTWGHMVKNRKEAEKRFIDLFVAPDKTCPKCAEWIWDRWENGVYNRDPIEERTIDMAITKAQNKLISVLDERVGPEVDSLNNFSRKDHDFSDGFFAKWEKQMLNLTHKKNPAVLAYIPEVVYVKLVDEKEKEKIYSLLMNRTYKTNSNPLAGAFEQNLVTIPEESQLIMIKGLMGNHPNLFITLNADNAFEFIDKFKMIRSQQDWKAFRNQFAVHRNKANFWKIYDELLDWQLANDPLDANGIDLNFYQMFE